MQSNVWYLPHRDTAKSLAIIQREARTHYVQAHSLTLMHRGQARTIVHTSRMLIFGFKLGVGWLQVWWARSLKPIFFPLYRPLVDGDGPVYDSAHPHEIEVTRPLALVATLSTLDDVSLQNWPTRPSAVTTEYALEIYQPATRTESPTCCSDAQLTAMLAVFVATLVLMTFAGVLSWKSKTKNRFINLPMGARPDEELEYVPRPSNLAQIVDSDSEDTEGGGVRLPTLAEDEVPVCENRPVRADPSGDAVSLPSILRGGRRNVSVHWHRELAREIKGHERSEKMKRMTKDWRLRAVD